LDIIVEVCDKNKNYVSNNPVLDEEQYNFESLEKLML